MFQLDKVAIKDLGTFVTYQTPARINEDKQIIEPPRKGVRFSEKKETDEEYFTTFLSEKENLSRVQAVELVEKYVDNIKKEVLQNIGYTIEGVGTFIEGANDNLRFIADPKANFSTQTYGLPEVELPKKVETPQNEPAYKQTTPVPPPPVVEQNTGYQSSQPKQQPNPTYQEPQTRQTTHAQSNTQNVHSNPPETVGNVLEDNANRREEVVEPRTPEYGYEEEKRKRGIWGWLVPLAALALACLLFFQLKWSNTGLKDVPPFSFFMGQDTNEDNNPSVETKNGETVEYVEPKSEQNIDGTSGTQTNETDYNNSGVSGSSGSSASSGSGATDPYTESTVDYSQSQGQQGGSQGSQSNQYDNGSQSGGTYNNNSGGSSSGYNSNSGNSGNSGSYGNSGSVGSGDAYTIESQYMSDLPRGYYGIVGVFSVLKNAQKYVAKLKAEGHQIYLVNRNGRYTAAIYLTNESERQADVELQYFRQQVNRDSWILKN